MSTDRYAEVCSLVMCIALHALVMCDALYIYNVHVCTCMYIAVHKDHATGDRPQIIAVESLSSQWVLYMKSQGQWQQQYH